MPNTSSESLEILKQEFENKLQDIKRAGEDLLRDHPRYETQAKELISIADKKLIECHSNMFSIALGADFQAGKSTTVNAMSDGRTICPSGNGGGGIRTSSCAVKVNYGTSQPTIIWKSKDTLSRDLEYWTGGQVSLTEQSDAERNVAFNEIAQNMTEQLKTYDTAIVDRMHQVLLYLSYYNDPQVKSWLSQNTFTTDEILSFLAFPDDNDDRWLNVQDKITQIPAPTVAEIQTIVREEFFPTNAMYLFIEMVNFETMSEYLQAMGITVIDTPGLNMTDNDTRVALSCMSDATSIFYFFEGERALSQSDLNALKVISDLGFKDKVFFGINFRSPLSKKAKVRQNIQTQIQNAGYNSPHQQELLLFNAFLAKRARQGRLILGDKLNRFDKDKILAEAEEMGSNATTVEQAWLDTTASVMDDVGLDGSEILSMGITKESIDIVYKASRWDDVMNFILDYVLENRSRILLIDRVAKPISEQLNIIEQILRRDEENATQNADNLKEKYQEAIRSYEDFQRECNEKLDERIKEDWDTLIANDFYQNVYAQCAPDIAMEAVDKIKKEQTFVNNVGFLATNAANRVRGFFGMANVESHLQKQCAAIMKSATEKIIDQMTLVWTVKFESGTLYQNTIRTSVDLLHGDILKIWNERNMANNEILKDLLIQLQNKLPKGNFSLDSGELELPSEALGRILDQQVQFGGAATDTLKGVVGGIIGGTGVAYVYLFILPMDFIVPFAAEIVGVITLAIAAAVTQFSSSARAAKDKKRLKDDLERNLSQTFSNINEREKIIKNLIKGGVNENGTPNPGLKIYRVFYRIAFEEAIKSCGEILKSQAKKAEEDAESGDKTRQQIANEARQIRKGVLATLQNSMNNLQKKVESLFPAPRA